MADSSFALHEHRDQMTRETMEQHRGIVSLMEELEAIDWYSQRIDATEDAQLKAVLVHNGDEEKEHVLQESFTALVFGPEAAVPLRHGARGTAD